MRTVKCFALLVALVVCSVRAQAQLHFINTGPFTISSGGEYEIRQTDPIATTNNILISTDDSVTITLNNVNMYSVTTTPPIRIEKAARVWLRIDGGSAIRANNNCSAIQLTDDASITISSRWGLDADTLYVKGGTNSAAIGTGPNGSGGNITIVSGKIVAEGGKYAAAIGTGYTAGRYSNTINSIVITGGTVIATGGDKGAGIGTGSIYGDDRTSNTINEIGNILISGGTVTATGGVYGAGIGTGHSVSSGGGYARSGIGSISITGGTVESLGNNMAAAIGTGYASNSGGAGDVICEVESIDISGGYVVAYGGGRSTAIGSGYSSGGGINNIVDTINITGGVVDAMASSEPHYIEIGSGQNSNCGRIIIAGGNVKALIVKTTNDTTQPVNNMGKSVFLAKLQNTNDAIEGVSVDGEIYNISGNIIGDSALYIFLQHASSADNVHRVGWKNVGLPSNHYDSARWNGSNFIFDNHPVAPSAPTLMTVTASAGFVMDYGSKNLRINIEVVAGGTPGGLVSAPMDALYIKVDTVKVIRETSSNWPQHTGLQVFRDPNIDVQQFGAGTHTLTVEYGGGVGAYYLPCQFTTNLTIRKGTPETPTGLSALTAVYGQTLEWVDFPIPNNAWDWKVPDSSVGNVGEHKFIAIYNPNPDNYNSIEVERTVRVVKDTLSCDSIERTGTQGSRLGDTPIATGWAWRYPDSVLRYAGTIQPHEAVPADTANNTYLGVCQVSVRVMPSTAVPLMAAQKKLTVYPNPIFAGNKLTVVLPTDEKVNTIEVYSIQGSLVGGYAVHSAAPQHIILKQHGIYIVKAGSATAIVEVF